MVSEQQQHVLAGTNTSAFWVRRSSVTHRLCTTAGISLLLRLDTMKAYAVAVQLLNA